MADVVFGSALRASGGIPSGPAAFPFFNCFNARSISALDGGLTVTLSRRSSVGVMVGISVGGGLFNMSRKCSAHLALCSCSSVMITPSLFLTGSGGLLLFPDIVLVMSYSLFIFRCPAALSASVARVSKNALILVFLSTFPYILIELPIP